MILYLLGYVFGCDLLPYRTQTTTQKQIYVAVASQNALIWDFIQSSI